ncbi:hypothetical protein BDQ17DRAFT_1433065 [Cyathus striatus]|nr:hypothetical protein BDQ17DRAFT_1433065 [Cyathus striatus]
MIDDVVTSGQNLTGKEECTVKSRGIAWLPLKSAEELRAKKGGKCKYHSTDTSETEQIDVEKNLDVPAKTKHMKKSIENDVVLKGGEKKGGGKKHDQRLKAIIIESDVELDDTVQASTRSSISLAQIQATVTQEAEFDNNEDSEDSSEHKGHAKEEDEENEENEEERYDAMLVEPVIRDPISKTGTFHQVNSLFSMPEDEAEVWASTQHSWSLSVGSSLPQTSKYEADFASDKESLQLKSNPNPPLALQHQHKSKAMVSKKSLCHDTAFQKEQPIVVDHKPMKRKSCGPCDNWPLHTRLVLAPNGRSLHLKDQCMVIHFLLTKVIQSENMKLLKDHSWLEFQQCNPFQLEIPVAVVEIHKSDIWRILRSSWNWTQISVLGLVLDCFAATQSPSKTNTAAHIAVYELGFGKKCKWSGKSDWVPQSDTPYLNIAISETLKTSYFIHSSSIGHDVITQYNIEMDNIEEPELPIAMVALGATTVYAALMEWKNSIKLAKSFDGNLFASTYQYHMESLETIQEQCPKAFHAIMHELY